jgi:uncharacterized Zn finger protein (UPF0148 family)
VSILGDAIGRSRRGGRAGAPPPAPEPASELASGRAPAPASRPAPGPVPAPAGRSAPGGEERSELRRRRDALAEHVIELHWDLGGLAYEMAIRDHFRLDVLVRRAAVLQERDAELAELERLLALQESASAGACPSCGAPHSRGAVYCWQCGTTLMQRAASIALPVAPAASDPARDSAASAPDGSTAVMNALLGRDGEDDEAARSSRATGSLAEE